MSANNLWSKHMADMVVCPILCVCVGGGGGSRGGVGSNRCAAGLCHNSTRTAEGAEAAVCTLTGKAMARVSLVCERKARWVWMLVVVRLCEQEQQQQQQRQQQQQQQQQRRRRQLW